MIPTPTTTLQSETGESVDQRPTPAGEGDLREEVAYWRRDLSARIWFLTGEYKAAVRRREWDHAAYISTKLRPALASYEAVEAREWHTRCEVCGEFLKPNEPYASSEDVTGHARCLIEGAQDEPNWPDTAEQDLAKRVEEGDAALAEDWPEDALAASPPQAETEGLDREASGLRNTLINARNSLAILGGDVDACWKTICEIDAILAATAVSQLPTSLHDAGEVEALRALNAVADATKRAAVEAKYEQDDWPILQVHMRCAAREFKDAAETYVRTRVLLAQPGPAPVGEGDAIEALERAAQALDACAGILANAGETAAEMEARIEAGLALRTRAALDSIPAVASGTGWRPDDVSPPEALYAWLLRHYEETDPTKGEAFRPVARKLVAALGDFIEAELPAAPTQTARDRGGAL